MTSASDHRAFQDLLAPYALDAVTGEEAALVAVHLDHCPRCRAEVDGFREVAGALGSTNAPVPSYLWDRVADALTQEWDEPATLPDELRRQLASPSVRTGSPAGVGEADAAVGSEQGRGHGKTGRTVGRSWMGASRSSRLLAVAASLVLLAALGVGVAHLQGPAPGRGSDAQGVERGVASALADPHHQLTRLHDPGGRTVAQVVVANGRGYLFDDSLATLSPDRTYQLWGVFGGRTISLGLLGSQPRIAAFSPGSSRPSAIMVTVEPSGGVVAPDTSPVATGTPV